MLLTYFQNAIGDNFCFPAVNLDFFGTQSKFKGILHMS